MEVGEYIAQQYPPTQGNARHAAALYKELMDDYTNPAEWWRIQSCTNKLKELAIYALSINPITKVAKRN
ncbi:hypothetical protein BU23DRAFT_562217 [Bimuria novae-zelandiae CBS 107.79]|uniref:Uncharacterized protein n=1 Tax=Bimuria novae-zelandiae CBS 107.79 TaxID=1447943 RepID=A0A6A5UIE9_9PLEO|nr:hypothetical protein BU23DRAFT_562217 [Bimuria novae-zelandiae CBS 107.79]